MLEARKTKARLAETVIEKIKADVGAGRHPPGSQLPTEPKLMEAFGVSRTVIREALAELRAAGFVHPIQGKGVFVTDRLPNTLLTLSQDERRSIPRTIELIEFRAAIEVEAAGLAAARRTSSQDFEILSKSRIMRQSIHDDSRTSQADFDFHMAIATASNNAYFVEALSQFGSAAIPRANLPNLTEARTPAYLETIQSEHDKIVAAISAQDVEGARAAMRAHLKNAQSRYRALALAVRDAPAS
ncbi:FadR/GntR family transcriptional regulator [Celeribacter indicus]|uniref:GntR family transcriptional regulator n=1 Tax=Celeribacter indicus TaxID=1208324 RepID=A0A0B5DYV6_9RHOB|nr:FadR/GntR family transcriptional regulator [Celeribacter indicus]AJE46365.1 GntR family transcriptional regulator [Celeribacter indicus]SDW54662.1 transcriptional regulator, GntR family [Celeribacter indicus]